MARVVRVRQGDRAQYGLLDGETIQLCDGTPFSRLDPVCGIPLASARLLPPVDAPKMVAIWRNSRPLVRSVGAAETVDLCYVIKPQTSFITHGDAIVLPAVSDRTIFEAELGMVIARSCRDVAEADAGKVVLGWTIVNEVTASGLINRDASFPQHTRAKSFDTFGVFGPWVDTSFDASHARIRCWQNGELRQDFGVDDLVRGPYRIIAELSRDMTLQAGDVIACGSSTGVQAMQPGDRIAIEIEGLGRLENPVRAA